MIRHTLAWHTDGAALQRRERLAAAEWSDGLLCALALTGSLAEFAQGASVIRDNSGAG